MTGSDEQREPPPGGISDLLVRMSATQDELTARGDGLAIFNGTYQRTTRAVAVDLDAGRFLDNAWVERWDVAFADLYLDALDGWRAHGRAPGPWRVAFGAAERYRPGAGEPLRPLLLGMNAHINYDLPQALLAVITDDELDDPIIVRRREMDHQRIDEILVSRVDAEDEVLEGQGGARKLSDRLLSPLNHASTRRFLVEARRKVWHNALTLSQARRQGPTVYAARLAELEAASAARVADLEAPGPVLLKLAVRGFGVVLPAAPAAGMLPQPRRDQP